MARPSKFTPEIGEEILEALDDGLTLEAAAECVGVHRDTVLEWRTKGERGIDPFVEFSVAIKSRIGTLKRKLLRLVRAGGQGWQGAAWILERRWPAEFSTRVHETVRAEQVELFELLKKQLNADHYAEVIRAIDSLRARQPPAPSAPTHGARTH